MANQPDWLAPVRAFCKQSNIEIMGWGEVTLVVKAAGTDQVKKVADELRSFGFEAIEDENDAEAGMLLLSRDRAATLAKMKK
jgi:phosphosulfolactate synthase (CoM biosynthesis protein A)